MCSISFPYRQTDSRDLSISCRYIILYGWALSGICINCFFGEAGATIALTGGWAGGWHQMPDPDLHLDIIN